MIQTFNIKRNDELPPLIVQVTDRDGAAVDLTDVTSAKFHMRTKGGTAVISAATAQVVAPGTAGILRYDWAAGQTATAGTYEAEFEVFFGSSSQTFPNPGYIRVRIREDIA